MLSSDAYLTFYGEGRRPHLLGVRRLFDVEEESTPSASSKWSARVDPPIDDGSASIETVVFWQHERSRGGDGVEGTPFRVNVWVSVGRRTYSGEVWRSGVDAAEGQPFPDAPRAEVTFSRGPRPADSLEYEVPRSSDARAACEIWTEGEGLTVMRLTESGSFWVRSQWSEHPMADAYAAIRSAFQADVVDEPWLSVEGRWTDDSWLIEAIPSGYRVSVVERIGIFNSDLTFSRISDVVSNTTSLSDLLESLGFADGRQP